MQRRCRGLFFSFFLIAVSLVSFSQPAKACPGVPVFDYCVYLELVKINVKLFKGLLGVSADSYNGSISQTYIVDGEYHPELGLVPGSQISPGSLQGTTTTLSGLPRVNYSSMTLDAASVADMAVRNALAKSVVSNKSKTASAVGETRNLAWRTRCDWKFLPTFDGDPEGRINRAIGCNERDNFARLDRTLEALIGPLNYRAPPNMVQPAGGGSQGGAFVRFPEYPGDEYYPILAAAWFCTTVGQFSYADVGIPAADYNSDVVNKMIMIETIDSRAVANCWRFFEARVRYGPDAKNFQVRHQDQLRRCRDDFVLRHIITLEQYSDCKRNGRSTMQARRDVAYRIESPQYTKKYLSIIGSTARSILIGLLMDSPERFEQSLLMERAIMSDAMGSIRQSPAVLGNQSYSVQ